MRGLKDKKEAGFTLVEVLISLFIFALISAGTMGAMVQTFAGKRQIESGIGGACGHRSIPLNRAGGYECPDFAPHA